MNDLKTGFFSALWGVCCGTSIFPRLLENPRMRAVWHLFLMSLLCTVLVSLRIFPLISGEWNTVAKNYADEFGTQIEFSEAGIRPERKPDVSQVDGKQRPRDLPMAGILIYTARGDKIDIPAGTLSDAKYILVWSNRFIAFAISIDKNERIGKKKWDVQLMRPQRQVEITRKDSDDLKRYFEDELKRPPADDEKWPLDDVQLKAAEVFRLFSILNGTVWFIYDWLSNFFLGLVCTGFFALLARLTGAATARGLTGWQYWQTGVYAGFPGMLIGGIVATVNVFPGYNIAYMLALVIYWLPAATAASAGRREAGPPAAPPEA